MCSSFSEWFPAYDLLRCGVVEVSCVADLASVGAPLLVLLVAGVRRFGAAQGRV